MEKTPQHTSPNESKNNCLHPFCNCMTITKEMEDSCRDIIIKKSQLAPKQISVRKQCRVGGGGSPRRNNLQAKILLLEFPDKLRVPPQRHLCILVIRMCSTHQQSHENTWKSFTDEAYVYNGIFLRPIQGDPYISDGLQEDVSRLVSASYADQVEITLGQLIRACSLLTSP